METTTQSPIQLTEGALRELRRIMSEPGFDSSQYLRIGVKRGGCSGMSYVLGFDSRNDSDAIYEFDGLPFLMEKSHELYLYGMQVDYQEGLNNRGFTFTNPNASSTCGCGSSFAV